MSQHKKSNLEFYLSEARVPSAKDKDTPEVMAKFAEAKGVNVPLYLSLRWELARPRVLETTLNYSGLTDCLWSRIRIKDCTLGRELMQIGKGMMLVRGLSGENGYSTSFPSEELASSLKSLYNLFYNDLIEREGIEAGRKTLIIFSEDLREEGLRGNLYVEMNRGTVKVVNGRDFEHWNSGSGDPYGFTLNLRRRWWNPFNSLSARVRVPDPGKSELKIKANEWKMDGCEEFAEYVLGQLRDDSQCKTGINYLRMIFLLPVIVPRQLNNPSSLVDPTENGYVKK